ncbi:MAG: FAD-binding oxidoreductase [Gammaproteobacteria bacterium]|nr:MAG: FAD-binding oxidoreductase [Gammaproteobacteria bacterium]
MDNITALPKGVSKAAFARAITELRGVLGESNVITGAAGLVSYTKIMLAVPDSEHQPSAALTVTTVDQIQRVLEICNKYRTPVWPISTGRNFGYGSAAPATAGQLVLDMRKMNAIIEVDAELGTALLEPGVTYVQLNEYLAANSLPYWLSFPSSGGLAGPMGNILDRGTGYNRYGEHAANFCGMEVVLADSTVLRTGMGGIPDTTAWQAYRWGLGPWADGLFLQSNLGIVTKIGVWLMKRPPAHLFFMVAYADLDMAARGVDTMRELRLSNVLETGVIGLTTYVLAATTRRSEIYQGEGSIPVEVMAKYLADRGLPPFATLSVLYGTEAQIAVNFGIAKQAFEAIGGTVISSGDALAGPGIAHWHQNMVGVPNLHEFGIYNFRGGGGSMWFAPVLPARGQEVIKVYRLLDGIFRQYGFDLAGGFVVHGRHLEMIVSLLFDRTSAEETGRAYDCFQQCLQACTSAGYGLYRVNTAFMQQASEAYGPAQKALNRRLKRALDPNGIIAPGKSGVYV